MNEKQNYVQEDILKCFVLLPQIPDIPSFKKHAFIALLKWINRCTEISDAL